MFTKIKQFQKKHHTELLKKFFPDCPTLDFFFFPTRTGCKYIFFCLSYIFPLKLLSSLLNVQEVSLYILDTYLLLLTLLSDSASDVFQSYQEPEGWKDLLFAHIYIMTIHLLWEIQFYPQQHIKKYHHKYNYVFAIGFRTIEINSIFVKINI